MRTDTPQIVRLDEYRPSDFLIDSVELDVRLSPSATRVTAKTAFRGNPAGRAGAPLVLDGDELVLTSLLLDGEALPAATFEATSQSLIIAVPPSGPFTLVVETKIDPSANTKLMGLFRSGGNYCTQCEAEGFRRIIYFLDRPDVLTVYTTRIEADLDEAPVLLGNGNKVESGKVPGTNRHYAVWHDPHPKPSYLFALVGGRLGRVAKPYRTAGGREVEIAIHVEPGKEERAGYALDALERAMRWDERVFGREYDLDVFNIVAVSDFNMGAMENKGLNIFNDKFVLASPDTATDADYASIEAIIAHEYFHNWTGNRITCRDWFQLCLKEGLTVFRDQEFSCDERSRPVHRIAEVKTLRTRQFSEDASPLAHPVRPLQYTEINNFYTATVYQKGAEIVRMLKTLLGPEDFRRGMDLYFERCDGTAATVETFLQAFADAAGRDLSHFARWYAQAGTPRVEVQGRYDAAARTYEIRFSQATPPTPGEDAKEPLVLPVVLGLVAREGGPLEARNDRLGANGLFTLDASSDSLIFENVASAPVPSVFRGFSAPVKVALDLSDADLRALLRYDTDPFNRWQAAQTVALRLLVAASRAGAEEVAASDGFARALLAFLEAEAVRDPAFAALVLTLPSEADVAQEIGHRVDPDAIHGARTALRREIGTHLGDCLRRLRDDLDRGDAYSPDAASAGRRSLRNTSLDLIAAADRQAGERLAGDQLERASNMTDRLAAFAVLTVLPGEAREQAITAFGGRYRDEPLVLDKWFALQAMIPEAGTLERVRRLMSHPAFSMSNPNRVRALIGSFASMNQTQFNRADGTGYEFVADAVLQLDAANPQVAARLLTAFGLWKMVDKPRRERARAALLRVAKNTNLSRDVSDIVQRTLA